MKPLVCFYNDKSLFYSTDYRVFSNQSSSVFSILEDIKKEYSEAVKILQIDFNLEKAHVFVLNTYEIISIDQLTSELSAPNLTFVSNISKSHFIKKVNTIKEDIKSGRYYQVNYTSSFSSLQETEISSYALFKYYLNQFKPAYPAYLPLPYGDILCFSPELFLEKKNERIRTCPIKGTTRNADGYASLLKDQKENAELSMIVDLLRNDLQSVCTEKVSVDVHRKELPLNYITHTYSQVSGATNLSLPMILKNMLPAGSISGCPKAESVKAIQELENLPRGFYTGCIGWWKNDSFTLNLAIRSFLYDNKKLSYFSGCGIVYDSDAEKEWQEFHHKAQHLTPEGRL